MKSYADAYILEYDNGQDYEEHRTELIAVVTGIAAHHYAEQEAVRLTAWMKRKHDGAPTCSTEMPDDEFAAALKRQNEYFAKLRVPHRAECLRQGARDGCASVRSYQVLRIVNA